MEEKKDRMRRREEKGDTFLFKPSLCCSMLLRTNLKGKRTIMIRKCVCMCVCVCVYVCVGEEGGRGGKGRREQKAFLFVRITFSQWC